MLGISYLVILVLGIGLLFGNYAFADHAEVTIEAAAGSGVPGCEETAEGCYLPGTATVDVGGKVIFSNNDNAAHTFTSGLPTDPDSVGAIFDSSLVMVGSTYEWTPTEAGEVPYYCAVHPWMQGLIIVQEAEAEEDESGPIDGSFTLPCSMQEAGDGVSSSSCYGFYTNEIARAEVGINYHSGLFPIEDYQAIGFFLDENGVQGSNISVTHNVINPGESATLIFENNVSGFVSEFQMQMLGGNLVIDEPSPELDSQTFSVAVGSEYYSVDVRTENLQVNSINPDFDFISLRLALDITPGTGVLEIDLDREFFDSTYEGIDDDFVVLVNGNQPEFDEIASTSTTRTLRITVESGNEIEIIGSVFGNSAPEPTPSSSGIDSLTIDKREFSIDDKFTISGTTSDAERVMLIASMTGPNGEKLTKNVLSDPGTFTFIPIDSGLLFKSKGLYTIKVFTEYQRVENAAIINVLYDNGVISQLSDYILDLKNIGNKQVVETEKLAFTASVTDPGIDDEEFSLAKQPSGATINKDTGVFSWTPTSSQVGGYIFDIVVKSGSLEDKETITVTVSDKSEPAPEPTNESESITFSTNRASYENGDTIVFSGSVNGYDPTSNKGVTYIIISPDNNIIGIGQLTTVTSDGSFSKSIDTDGPLWKLDGDYIIEVHYASFEADVEFEFETNDDYPSPTPTTDPEILSLSTKKSKYKTGDTIVITGKVNTSDFSKAVTLQVFQGGNLVDVSQVSVSLNESFSRTIIAEGPLWMESGKYTIKATYGNDIEDTSFVYKYENSPNKVNSKCGAGTVFNPKTESCVLDSKPAPKPTDKVTIVPANGSGAPGCEETSQGCYLPSVASVSVGGVVIFSNPDTAAHTFTSGEATKADSVGAIFDSSLVMSGSSYKWFPSEEGVVDYFCMVHPWMTGIILVGEGTVPPKPQPHTSIDLEVSVNQKVYDLDDLVRVLVEIDGISGTQRVAVDVTDPRGNSVVSRTLTFTSDGVNDVEFRISDDFKTGNYKVTATTSDNRKTIKDTAYFKVKSQYNSFKITNVEVTDQQGNPSNLEAGEIGFIKVNLDSSKSISTLVTVNIFDSELTSIGIGSIQTRLSSGNTEIILSFMIPEDAAVGTADIYVNAFSDWPSNGGIPLTSEFSISEFIGGSTPEPTPVPEPTVRIFLETDRSSYSNGANVEISGSIIGYDSTSNKKATYIIISPDDRIVGIGQLTIVNTDGTFKKSFIAGGPLWKSNGDYTVEFHYGADESTITINYVGGEQVVSKPVEPEPTAPEPTAPEPTSTTNSIVVSTDKTSYSEGETILVTGEVQKIIPGVKVSVIVKDPNGNLVSIAQVIVGADKKFSTEASAGGSLMKAEGTYTVVAQYSTVNISDTATFEFGGSTATPPSGGTVTDSTASIQGTNELIQYTITGSKLNSIMPDRNSSSLIVSIDSRTNGILTLTIPRTILDATYNDKDREFLVLIDGEDVEYTEIKSSTDRKLFVGLKAGVEEIEIIGTFVI